VLNYVRDLTPISRAAIARETTLNKSTVSAIVESEPNALQVLREMGKFLGIGISNLIVGLSPQAVVVSGSVIAAWDIISDEIHAFAERSVRNGLPKTFLTTSTLGSQPTLIGAINLVLARKFASA